MANIFTNNASSTLANTIAPADVTVVVASGHGSRFPFPSNGNVFSVTVQDVGGNIEVMTCSARTADVLTVVRAQQGTTAQSFLAGAVVEHRLTAGDMSSFSSKAENLADLASIPTARTNLGLGTAALEADTKYNYRANNLNDVANVVTARANLGLAINTNVQAYHSSLFAISGLGVADNNFIVGNGTTLVMESGATARTSLGLGSMALANATISTDAPSGGVDGDVWYRVE